MAEATAETTLQAKASQSQSIGMVEELFFGAAEETLSRSPMVPESYENPYNPDDLYRKRGDYSIYEDMLNDDQVSICLDLKKDLVIGSGLEFRLEDESQREIADQLEELLSGSCETPFQEACEEILSAYEFGFSISEAVFKTMSDGRMALKSMKTRHPATWLIHQDEFGNVSKYEQITDKGNKEIDGKRLIHFVNRRKFQNPYGKSDLRVAFNAWFVKRQVIKYYAIYLEKAASPIPVAKYDDGVSSQAITDIHNRLKEFQAKTALTIPKKIHLEFLEAKTAGEAYARALDILNMYIGRALFVPDLLGMTGSETGGGSYSLGTEQIGLFFMHIMRRRAALEDILNKHLVRPLVIYNFGDIPNYPKLRFKHLDDAKAVELAKTWLEAVKSKVFKPNEDEINYFRKLVKFPEGEVEFSEPVAMDPLTGLPASPAKLPTPAPADDESGKKEALEDAKGEPGEKKAFGAIFDLPSGNYHKKVDFAAIEAKLNDYDKSVLSESKGIVKRMLTDLFDQIEKKKIIQNQRIDRVDTLKLKGLKDLKQVLKKSFSEIYKDGQIQAQDEIFRANFRSPVTSDKFLEILEAETFQYVGSFQTSITQKVRAELVAAIKDGASIASVLDGLEQSLSDFSETSIERFARTKHTEVLNKGRLEFFESTGVVAGYQYSAVLDDRTSTICRGLHGKKFKAGDQPIPPMHFNCRSVLVPITKYEEFSPDASVGKTPIGDFIKENKGEGFPVK